MKEILINNQTWIIENLDVSTYRNGDPIPQIQSSEEWGNLKTGAWCYYGNDEKNRPKGKLYNWFAINDPRGIAPRGYRIASHYDWLKLGENLDGSWNASDKLQSLDFFDYYSGYRDECGRFAYWDEGIGWWTSDELNMNYHALWAQSHFLLKNENGILWKPFDKKCGFYVRCLKQNYEKVNIIFDEDLFLQTNSIVYKYRESNTFQDLLNFLYSNILEGKVNINSYGREWIIEKYYGEALEKILKVNTIDNRKLYKLLWSSTPIENVELICRRLI